MQVSRRVYRFTLTSTERCLNGLFHPVPSVFTMQRKGSILASVAMVVTMSTGSADAQQFRDTKLPIRGWSTWNTFAFEATEELVRSTADFMVANGFKDKGYEYILIDDGWSRCQEHGPDPWDTPGGCKNRDGARDPITGQIMHDPVKFPNGIKAVADYVHSLGLKIGMYTGVGPRTCGGYEGSYMNEEKDVQAWAAWGVDFIKHDVCLDYCGVHDGCLQNATQRMGDAIKNSGREIIYYVDNGPTNPPRLYNPFGRWVVPGFEEMSKLSHDMKPNENIFLWAPALGANMWKPWMDIVDDFYSTLDNAQAQIGAQVHQSCGKFNFPDMLTIGQGSQTFEEYRTQLALWSVLGSPFIIGADVRSLNAQDLGLLLHEGALEVQGDSDCVQASMVRSMEGFMTWIKPMSDGSFAAAIVNPTRNKMQAPLFLFSNLMQDCGNWYRQSRSRRPLSCNGGDLWPAQAATGGVKVVDIWTGNTIAENVKDYITVDIAPHDTAFLRLYPSDYMMPSLNPDRPDASNLPTPLHITGTQPPQ